MAFQTCTSGVSVSRIRPSKSKSKARIDIAARVYHPVSGPLMGCGEGLPMRKMPIPGASNAYLSLNRLVLFSCRRGLAMMDLKIGKGVYIWRPASISGGDPEAIAGRLEAAGVQTAVLQICDGFQVLSD